MTALEKYQRLEAAGIWRASPEAQRRDAIVSIGDSTLVITDLRENVLAHWSLAAIARANPGALPAVYHPEGDPGEELELDAAETEMIEAIETLRQAVERRRPHPGRLRFAIRAGIAAVVLGLGVFWLPGAMIRHTASVVPEAGRAQIGAALQERIARFTGSPCAAPGARDALTRLAARLELPARGMRLAVVPGGVQDTAHLPGGAILMNAALIEDHEDPAVPAGYILAEMARAGAHDPLLSLLQRQGLGATVHLLTRGSLPGSALDREAEALLAAPPAPVETAALLDSFAAAKVPSSPYAYALDVSGESVLPLIEGDPATASGGWPPVLRDGTWVRLQGICGN